LIPFFADACLHALVGPDTLPWAGGYTRNSFAGGGSRPLGRSRPPPPKADLYPRPARMLPVILPVICGVKSFNTEIKGALASAVRALENGTPRPDLDFAGH